MDLRRILPRANARGELQDSWQSENVFLSEAIRDRLPLNLSLSSSDCYASASGKAESFGENSWIMKNILLQFLQSLLIGTVTSLLIVLLGIKSLKDYLKGLELKREYGILKNFWSTAQTDRTYTLIFGSEEGEQSAFEVEPRVGYSQAFGIAEITRLLEGLHERRANIVPLLLSRDDPFPKTAFDTNVLLFGGERVLSRFRQFSIDLGVPFYQHTLELDRRSFTRSDNNSVVEKLTSQVDYEKKKIHRDFGTVTRIINPLNGKLLFLFNANYSAGLLGAILATTRKESFQHQSFDQTKTAQQAVVEVPSIQDNLITREHPIVMRNWIQFQVTTDQVSKALERASAQLKK